MRAVEGQTKLGTHQIQSREVPQSPLETGMDFYFLRRFDFFLLAYQCPCTKKDHSSCAQKFTLQLGDPRASDILLDLCREHFDEGKVGGGDAP